MKGLAAGGLGGVCISHGGSICELTNWDGTKKMNKWESVNIAFFIVQHLSKIIWKYKYKINSFAGFSTNRYICTTVDIDGNVQDPAKGQV